MSPLECSNKSNTNTNDWGATYKYELCLAQWLARFVVFEIVARITRVKDFD